MSSARRASGGSTAANGRTPAILLDGKAVAARMRQVLAARSAELTEIFKRPPGLAVIQVGSDPASTVYVRNKRRAAIESGMESFGHFLPSSVTQTELLSLVEQLNGNDRVDGILVQLPLPARLDATLLMDAIDPAKDVDGFHPFNMGLLAQKRPVLRPCTPHGVIRLAEEYGIGLRGLNAVVVGASNIVGRPMALELLLAGATVTVCHTSTRDLRAAVETADLVVAAVGKPGLIRGDWIKPGAAVFDVGINRDLQGNLVGDVDFHAAAERAAWITPVPGGLGPMTIAMLLWNTVEAASRRTAF